MRNTDAAFNVGYTFVQIYFFHFSEIKLKCLKYTEGKWLEALQPIACTNHF